MKIFNLFVLFLSCLFSYFVNPVFAEEPWEKAKLKAANDAILVTGYGSQEKLNESLQRYNTEKEEAFNNGLKKFEDMAKGGSSTHQQHLAFFYYINKNFKKGLYWANKCAEQGSYEGMEILAVAYFSGEGVVEDKIECFKWAFLAEAVGDKEAKKMMDQLRGDIKDFDYNEIVNLGRKRAQDWIKTRPQLFFNPD